MYNDTLNTTNKIISYEDLVEIFSAMQEKLDFYKKVYVNEEAQNKDLDFFDQRWTFKDNDFYSRLTFNVDFYDDTSIKFDNYNDFMGIFNNRLHEIKSIFSTFNISYSVYKENKESYHYSQYINMWLTETKTDITVSLSSEDKKIDDIFELIKNKILNAPTKYDYIIKKKRTIYNTVGMGIALIPSLILLTSLLFVPAIKAAFISSYVLYPISVLIVAFLLGEIVSSIVLDGLYKNIIPEKEYDGYDTKRNVSKYSDNINKYIETSEILIGKNTNNLKYRKTIKNKYEKYKKYIPIELVILGILSIIVLFLK